MKTEYAPGILRPLWVFLLAAVILIVPVALSFTYLSLDFSRLFTSEALSGMMQFAARFFPPDMSPDFLRKIFHATLQTISISAVGTILAAAAGLVLALPAAGRMGILCKTVVRFVLNFLRSVPELVWAVLMVLAVGLGPFAGALALALHTTGVLGRLFAEALENADPRPTLSLVEKGTRPGLAFFYGTMPVILPQITAYSLYRWEMNIRMAAILGFVGAGGLGQMLYFELSLLHEAQASTVIFAMFALVVVVDRSSAFLRRLLS